MSKLRISHPVYFEGITSFSDDRAQISPVENTRLLLSQPWIVDDLIRVTTVDNPAGRKRSAGRWILAYVAFVSSRKVDVEPWWSESVDTEIWQLAGFPRRLEQETGRTTHRPSYQNTQRRFAELEKFADDIRGLAGRLMRRAMEHDPRIAHHIHVDSTEAETHASLVHDCPDDELCMKYSAAKRGVVAKRPGRVTTAEQRAVRQQLAELPTEEELALRHKDGTWDAMQETSDGRVRVRSGKHWYRTLDPTAGHRAYHRDGKLFKYWHGFYVQQAISHLYGAPLAVAMASASQNEMDIYIEQTFPQLEENIGVRPQSATFDRGFSWAPVYEFNTKRRVASVMPFRRRSGVEHQHDELGYDRHGVVRCRGCGGPTRLIREAADPTPRLWVECDRGARGMPHTVECAKVQSVSCSADFRVLTRLPKTDERYQTLKVSHSMFERVHRLWRERWRVGGNDLSSRPKRMGINCQNLRAQTALLLEWLLICSREGFLGRAATPAQGALAG